MRLFYCALLVGLSFCTTPGATAEAALSNDGNRVVFRPWWDDAGPLVDVDLRTGKATRLDPAAFGAPGDFVPQACSKSDFVLGTTGPLLLACDLGKKKTVTIYKAPEGVMLNDLAYNPKDGSILLSCDDERKTDSSDDYRSPLLYVPTDTSKAGFVFCRRVEHLDGIAFATDGTLYFTSRGDVWVGQIQSEEGAGLNYVLTGQRIAPVAVLETYVGTSASTGAHEVAVAGNKLYVHSFRLGGSGLGDLFTIDRPKASPGSADGDPGTQDAYAKLASTALGSLKMIQPYDRPPTLASSPNGRFVIYGFRSETEMELHLVDAEKNTSRKISIHVE